MGNKDKTWNENAATSSEESRDTALARTITQAVARPLPSKKPKRPNLSQKLSQGRWRRLRRSMKSF